MSSLGAVSRFAPCHPRHASDLLSTSVVVVVVELTTVAVIGTLEPSSTYWAVALDAMRLGPGDEPSLGRCYELVRG
jgi:hypothetical protein